MHDTQTVTTAGSGCWLDHAPFSMRPMTVEEALAALDGVTEHFARLGDPRAAFPDIYAIITRRVAERAAWGRRRYFQEPAWISRLAGRFCERYLETLRWSLTGQRQDCGAWEVTYALPREHPDAPPIQHAFLGLSAHINYDLAIGISRTLADFGAAKDRALLARCKHDHDVVNELLRQSVPEALQRLASREGCATSGMLLERARRSEEWATMAILGPWRDRVWGDAVALLRETSLPARSLVLHRMERRSHRIAHALASPTVAARMVFDRARARLVRVTSWASPSF
jgi:hypothetical protein